MLSPRVTEPINARATRLYFQNFMCILQPLGLGCDAEDCQRRIYIWIACYPIVKASAYLCQPTPNFKTMTPHSPGGLPFFRSATKSDQSGSNWRGFSLLRRTKVLP